MKNLKVKVFGQHQKRQSIGVKEADPTISHERSLEMQGGSFQDIVRLQNNIYVNDQEEPKSGTLRTAANVNIKNGVESDVSIQSLSPITYAK